MAALDPGHSVAVTLDRGLKEIPMPATAAPQPNLSLAVYDDPDLPGRYLTDGEHLFRLLGADVVRNNYIEIEDCKTLEIWLVDSGELRSWGMWAVCRSALLAAAA
jgi:hypothetical protein